MKKQIILTGLLLLAHGPLPIANAQPITVAICGIHDVQKRLPPPYGDKATALVTANLTTETNLVLLERTSLDTVLHEQAFGASGMVSSDAAAKIGQITGAKVLVTGQVLRIGRDKLVVIANIIGTETGRLFAAKVAGPADQLVEMCTDLSKQTAEIITAQSGKLLAAKAESRDERIDRIIKNLTGTNRPSVSVNLRRPSGMAPAAATGEMGAVLMKAGFPVVDGKSQRKPDFEILGIESVNPGPAANGLITMEACITAEVRERKSGKFIAFERADAMGADAAKASADQLAQENAVDAVAEKILAALAK
jgi:hypothetical protein